MTSQGSERNVHQCLQISPRPYSKSPLRGEASSRHLVRWLKTVVLSEVEKASGEASGGDWGGGHCLRRRKD